MKVLRAYKLIRVWSAVVVVRGADNVCGGGAGSGAECGVGMGMFFLRAHYC